MGLTEPDFPDLDLEAWRLGTRSERLKPMARHVASVGFGTPDIVYALYAVKIALYVLGGWLFALSTPGVDGFTHIATWWSAPVVFLKVVLWTMLFEVLGMGCGFGPLNLRISPPLGSFLYWLRPGTIRMPPWPTRVPGTRGTTRTAVDAILYGGLLVSLVVALAGSIDRRQIVAVLVFLAAIGLRDKTIFLAARSEVYAPLAITFLFTDPGDVLVGAKLVMVLIWWGAATSKLNRHFPNVVACMLSNSPVIRSRRLKLLLHKGFPDDLRPSTVAVTIAHVSTGVEFLVPVFLFLSRGGAITAIAATVMILFHLNILVSMPQGAPLEWNVFMCFAIGTLFVKHADYGFADVSHRWVLVLMVAVIVAIVAYGNARPDHVSFLPAMRYYAGNWDTSIWCFTDSGLTKLRDGTVRAAVLPFDALEAFYGKEQMVLPIWIGYAFRAMHTHGRALMTLIHRTIGEEDRVLLEGELVAGVILGWNFGDGHLHNEQLALALQERCGFAPGEVQIVMLGAQPIQRQAQPYRIFDPAVGVLESGEVDVQAMLDAQPWDLIPVRVLSST